jgi:serine phosphatase RsbU (regulator of sigma subunit)
VNAEASARYVRPPLCFGSAIRPCRGERVSGDAVVTVPAEQLTLIAIIDGLGHGVEAHAAALSAKEFLEASRDRDVVSLMAALHEHLRGSRGAAAGLCVVESATGALRYTGIGNTVIRRFGSQETRLVSRDGVLGQNARTPWLQRMTLEPRDVVLLYTDGVRDRFSLDDYRGLLFHEPDEVARTLLKRFGKDHDDAACIALRYRP